MRITEFQIDQYGPLPRIEHSCDDGGLEVFYGPNESGKTLIIEALLKLMAPDIGDVASGVDRVSDAPTGYVMVDTPQGERKLGADAALTDLDAITPHHLENVFAIRDSSLRIPGEHDYYDSVTEQIGDLHTSEIRTIRDRLVDEGNLTQTRLNLERSGSPKTRDVHEEATSLLSDVRTYVEEAERDEIETAERRRLELRRELCDAEERLDRLDDARRLDQHRTLRRRLEEYRTATAELEEIAVSEDDLSTLHELERDVDRLSGEIASTEADVEEHQARIRSFEEDLDDAEATLEPLAEREDDVAELQSAVEKYRATDEAAIGASSLVRPLTVGSLLCLGSGGVAASVGDAALGAVFLVLGVVLGGVAYGKHRRSRTATRHEQRVLNRARDVGFVVDSVDEVAPRIREFSDDVDERRSRRDRLERNLEVEAERLADARDRLGDREDELSEARARTDSLLQAAGLADVAEYERLVDQRQEHLSTRDSAAQSLADSFGVPGVDGASHEAMVAHWEAELDALVEDVDTGDVSADEYDEEVHSSLAERVEDLERELDGLRERLDAHEEQVQAFDDRVASLSARPYLGEPISLSVETVDGLRAVSSRLEDLVEAIELSADVSREAIDVFDGLRRAEEQKIASLFEDGTATEVFTTITDGRYTDVQYSTDAQVLEVTRDDGRVHTPDELSKGTTDQLYLAARMSLARQLLSSQRGFFIMDDAFLPADDQRLAEGFRELRELVAEDWQVLYFTAKSEVGDGIATDLEIPCMELDPLP